MIKPNSPTENALRAKRTSKVEELLEAEQEDQVRKIFLLNFIK